MTEILSNPGFESRTGDNWTDWTEISGPVAEATIVHSGSCSVNISASNAGMGSLYYPITPGLFKFSIWVYGVGSPQVNIEVYESTSWGGDRILHETGISVPNGVWTQIVRYCDSEATEFGPELYVSIVHDGSTGTELYIDDASLELVSSIGNTFHNGDLEVWRSENGYPQEWVTEAPVPSRVYKDASVVHSGGYSVRLEKVGTTNRPKVHQLWDITFGPHLFSIWIKSDGVATVELYATASGQSAYYEDTGLITYSGSGWTQRTLSFDVPTDPAEQPVIFYFYVRPYLTGADGYVWADDCQLTGPTPITDVGGITSAEAFGSLARLASDPAFVGVSMITPITVSLEDAFTGLTVSEIVTTTVSLEEEII